jgi:hypothetical protein
MISAPPMKSPYSFSFSPTRAIDASLGVERDDRIDAAARQVGNQRPEAILDGPVDDRYSPEPRDAASSDSAMMASRPSLPTWSIHLWASTLNICSAAYCARSRRCPSSGPAAARTAAAR